MSLKGWVTYVKKPYIGWVTVIFIVEKVRDRSLVIIGVGPENKMVGQRKFLGGQRLGKKKLDMARGWIRMSNVALKYMILTKNVSCQIVFR